MISTKDFLNIANKYGKFKLVDGHSYVSTTIKHPVICPKCDHQWFASYNNLKAGCGCPECKRANGKAARYSRLTPPSTNDFVTKLNIARPNLKLVQGSKYVNNYTKVNIRCEKGHEWFVRPHHILGGSGCPECSPKHLTNEIVDARLVGEYENFERISDVVVGGKTIFRCCEGSHTFELSPSVFLNNKNRIKCPVCSKLVGSGGYNPNKIGVLYFATVVVNDTILYKVGITNRDPMKRLAESFKKFKLYKTLKGDGRVIQTLESHILNSLKHLRAFKRSDEADCDSGKTELFLDEPSKYFTKADLQKVVIKKFS